MGEKVSVPSVTDHAWILIRTDLVSRPYLPRFFDMIELVGTYFFAAVEYRIYLLKGALNKFAGNGK